MNRIEALFNRKSERVLSIYTTAGYPYLESTVHVLEQLEKSGADMIEVGIPFSDPLADGPVIQESSQIALRNGMTLEILFEQLNDIRSVVSIPLVLMGYLNPVLQFGFDRFIENCVRCGIDGLIIPDLPLREYNDSYRKRVTHAGLAFNMLITPQTTPGRIETIAAASDGFLYMVSDAATTGAKSGISRTQVDYFQRIRAMELAIPRLIGFGISSAETFNLACEYAHGAIIGSAFITAIGNAEPQNLETKVREFVQGKILAPAH